MFIKNFTKSIPSKEIAIALTQKTTSNRLSPYDKEFTRSRHDTNKITIRYKIYDRESAREHEKHVDTHFDRSKTYRSCKIRLETTKS